ncbi:45 kDa calcium-binding protein isoform X1 [Microplitis mediator]|uniref:45 kDa calcium-binding protein isoform X1 n=1 Tax=Microplitis mediator TaxID=375433 RepID=UPI002553A935|nr:45 kDa calcium-binding protein isoform X1 [Microplitis mediator]XP_057318090.1 45 kDa calcium-binding protein isoform X1 [Microplitis mediator]XP_057318091.1 45 kDa calcium-binding protein isoform X1 [Microplitis mediator]XP_057318092.1 45 kDa calcium-binding protein isoform X1 [Microplitis mediator]
MRKLNFKKLTIARWTIFVPLIIYMSLLYIKYNRNMKLKSPDEMDEDAGIQNLFSELESVSLQSFKDSNVNIDKSIIKSFNFNNNENNVEREIHDNPRLLLENIFSKADADENRELDIQEVAKWIHSKIIQHIDRAMRDNVGLFSIIDINPRNGDISWDEYHAYFLRLHGFSDLYIKSHNKKHSELTRTLKESIMRDRARWIEAARTDPDKLTLDEFLAFTHPESSHRALLQMVDDLFEKFDRDGDEELTENEFADLPVDGMGLDLREDTPEPIGGSEGRRQEFQYLIDKNKDGKADRSELLMYIDPKNPRHAIQEAQHLMDLADIDHNKKLSLSEVLSKTDLFLGSKMVDTERSFHDEFR